MSTATRWANKTIGISILFALLLGAGCSSTGGGAKPADKEPSGPSALASGKKIAKLSIAIDDQQLTPEAVQAAQQFSVATKLDSQLRRVLPSGSIATTGQLQVDVKLVGMRLRSTGTAIWWGVMAGADWLTVDVEVSEQGRAVKSFQTGISTALGGFAYGGREVRVDRMVAGLAKRIAAGI